MPTYFGNNNTSTTYSTGYASIWARNKNYVTGYTCPGSGLQQVNEITAYVVRGATGQYIRCAVYTAAHALVCQGSARVAIPASAAWTGHTAADQITPNPATLTGGTQYDIALSGTGSTARYYYQAGSNGDTTYSTNDYCTGGFPDPLADSTDTSIRACIRCGVDPFGLSIPVVSEALNFGEDLD